MDGELTEEQLREQRAHARGVLREIERAIAATGVDAVTEIVVQADGSLAVEVSKGPAAHLNASGTPTDVPEYGTRFVLVEKHGDLPAWTVLAFDRYDAAARLYRFRRAEVEDVPLASMRLVRRLR
jgi:hypothetical protein